MASLYEYFVRDGAQNLTTHRTWQLTGVDGEQFGEAIARLHLDFDAHARYISFYIPDMPLLECPEAILLNDVDDLLKMTETSVGVRAGFGDDRKDARELVFTGQIYLYSERPVPDELKMQLTTEAMKIGHHLTFRSSEYVSERNKWEKPLAFISHDSRDKKAIAEPIALQLQKLRCPVWYDQFSLRVGDSLRESVEKGLKECAKCVLILTPNFLRNGGWSKREYDSIFTREIVEQRKVILPVWHDVTPEDLYEYSPILADRMAVPWSLGVEEVARKLFQAINSAA